jgi:hypothetical protein
MPRSEEWRFRLGPLECGFGYRASDLQEFRGAEPRESHARPEVSRVAAPSHDWTGRPPPELMVWESEGGSLG